MALNFKILDDVSNGNKDFKNKLFKSLRNDLNISFDELEKGLIEKDFTQIRNSLHKLKPLLESISAVDSMNLINETKDIYKMEPKLLDSQLDLFRKNKRFVLKSIDSEIL